jgi:hypothetical protein
MLPVTLVNGNRSVHAFGLLDTGADVNVLPYDLGIEIGAVWENQRPIPRLSGNLAQQETRGIVLTCSIENFAPVRLAFAWTGANAVPLILGQTNFFAEFDVCFFRSESAFELRVKIEKQHDLS